MPTLYFNGSHQTKSLTKRQVNGKYPKILSCNDKWSEHLWTAFLVTRYVYSNLGDRRSNICATPYITINLTPSKINNHALFSYSVCVPFCALLFIVLCFNLSCGNRISFSQFNFIYKFCFLRKKKCICSLNFQGKSPFMKHRNFCIRKVHALTSPTDACNKFSSKQ